MKLGNGKIIEIRQPSQGKRQALIRLERITTPMPGQYLQAHHLLETEQPVGCTLLPGSLDDLGSNLMLTAPGIPLRWQPGECLKLRGPLGKGFQMDPGVKQLALAAFGPESDHLLPLAGEVLARDGEVALFTDGDFPKLPARVEINQLANLHDAIAWADFIAVSVPLEKLNEARAVLSAHAPVRCTVQVLVIDQFPCAGIAKCGICAIHGKKGNILQTCEDGPVFDWGQLG